MTTQNIFFLSILLTLMSSCSSSTSEEMSTASPEATGIFVSQGQFKTLRMQNAQVIDTVLTEHIELKGRVSVAPDSQYDLSLPFNGQVTEIYVQIGDEVTKGEPLLVVRSAEYADLQERHLKAQAQVTYLSGQANRSKVLNDAEVTATAERERIESELQRAEAELQSLKAQLEIAGTSNTTSVTNRLVIRAPHSGVVTDLPVNLGHYLEAYRPAVTLLDRSGLRLELSAFDHQVAALQKGAVIAFRTIGSNASFTAVLSQIVPKSNGQDRAFRIIAERGAADWSALQPGLAVTASVSGEEQRLKVFPSSALTGDPGHPSLFAVQPVNSNSGTADTAGFRYTKVRPEMVFVSGEWAGVSDESLKAGDIVLAQGAQHISIE